MGRDVTGLCVDKKSSVVNDKSNSAILVAPKALAEISVKNDCERKDHDSNATLPDECNDIQDVLGVKSANHQPEEKIIMAEAQKSIEKKLISPSLEDEQQNSCVIHANGAENNDSEVLQKSSDSHSPMSEKKSQPNNSFLTRKQLQPHCKNYYDEEDNWSLASSTATSVRTKITVPVAPRFTCDNRLERRKQFYTKLEEKHKALEKEKLEYEARNKEEEQAAIKQLRKAMMYKANPVPSFYREGPPPKVELKKLPVTRAKSPNLTRRKSCSDTVKSSPEDKGPCGRVTRHSIGVFGEGKASPLQKKASPLQKKASPLQKKVSPITPKGKDQSHVQRPNGPNKVKIYPHQSKEMSENSAAKEQRNEEITVES